MSKFEIIIFALAVSFVLVELRPRIKLFNRKPFNCMMCMCGWVSLFLSLWQGYKWEGLLMMCVGLFAGAMFEAVKMRWL